MERGRGTKKRDKAGFLHQSVAMFLVLLFSYSIISLVNYGFGVLRYGADILDPESRDLDRIATYLRPIDPDLASFADDAHQLLDAYVAGDNIFVDNRERLDRVWKYVSDNHTRLDRLGFRGYDDLFNVLVSLYPHREEVYQLMGSGKPLTYLVALQNTGEIRPNGGFFGSFVVATIKDGQLESFQPIDSYFPKFISKNMTIPAEEWWSDVRDESTLGFIDINRYGFTDMDGANIEKLYEKIFDRDWDLSAVQSGPYRDSWKDVHKKDIKGVVFLRTDMIEGLIPGFEKKIWEWQFVNASVDLIRGEDRTNKKEYYMMDMKNFFEENRVGMVLGFLGQIGKIQQNHHINVYLSDVSEGLNKWLRDQHFANTYDENHIYLRDHNFAHNKIDRFVTKEIVISRNDRVVAEYVNSDIISIENLDPGDYILDIYYKINVPQQYRDFMLSMATEYKIALTDREFGIFGLEPTPWRGQLWYTRSLAHFPRSRKIGDISGDIFDLKKGSSDFSQYAAYHAQTTDNNSTSNVSLKFTIPQK